MNKYKKWYTNIVKNAQSRITDEYTEKHHIVPKSLGGRDIPKNLVNLTAREHFICHWLLTKIYTGVSYYKMIKALSYMRAENNTYHDRYKTKITARVYKNLREDLAEAIKKHNTGRVQPQHEKEKQVKAQTGRTREPFTEEWISNMSEAHLGEKNGMWNKKHKASSIEIIREKATGRKQSAETIKKKADAIRGSKREKKLCPHCGRKIAVNGYARFHGDKCNER